MSRAVKLFVLLVTVAVVLPAFADDQAEGDDDDDPKKSTSIEILLV